MGQSQSSRPVIIDSLTTDLVKQMALIMHSESDDKWVPEALSGSIVLNKRLDGSTVKELYIPRWNVVFFQSGPAIAFRTQKEVLEGKPVRLIVAHSILLHNLLIKSKDYLNASDIAKEAFNTYLGVSDEKN